jgi:hypothetical protein
LGVHLELAILGLLLGCVLALVDLFAWSTLNDYAGASRAKALWPWLWAVMPLAATLPTLFLFLPILAVLAGMLSCTYWLMPVSLYALLALAGQSSRDNARRPDRQRGGEPLGSPGPGPRIAWRDGELPAFGWRSQPDTGRQQALRKGMRF